MASFTPCRSAYGPSSASASAIRSRAPCRSWSHGEAAGDQDQDLGAEGGGLVDRAAVVVQRLGALVRVGRREEAAAAEGGDGKTGVADQLRRRLHTVRLDRFTPEAHPGDAQFHAGVDQFGHRQLLDRHLVDGEAGEICGAHWVTPYRLSRFFMRSWASFGSGNRPRPSASS